MAVSLRQDSFAAGELAPEWWGRTRHPRYVEGARRMRNWLPIRSGAAMTRAGTDYCAAVASSAVRGRLLPYVYSSAAGQVSYILEFGNTTVRVWLNGAQVATVTGSPPWLEAELPALQWAQDGNTLTVCHPSHAPKEISYDGTTWKVAAASFTRPSAFVVPSISGYGFADSSHPAQPWVWLVTAIRKTSAGVEYESAPVSVPQTVQPRTYAGGATYGQGEYVSNGGSVYQSLADNNTGHALTDTNWWKAIATPPSPYPVPVAADRPVTLALTDASSGNTTDTLVTWRVYRSRGGASGWVGDTTGNTFVDVGDQPDWATAPPAGENPFLVNGVPENPAAVTYAQQRRVFGGLPSRPSTILASVIGQYSNFDHTAVVESPQDALILAPASGKGEQIRSLACASDLVELTNASAWVISGSGGPVTFPNVDISRRADVGATTLAPLVVDGSVLYVRAQGTGIVSLAYEFQRRGFAATDLALFAQHLLRGHSIQEWAWAASPWSTVWMVRDDGVLLSLTLSAEESMVAWAWHDTQGTVESVCVVPEGNEDAVYLIVNRGSIGGSTKRYVERMHSRVLALNPDGTVDAVQAFALDCAKSVTNGAPTSSVTGLDHLEGKQVYAVADGGVLGPFTVAGGAIDLGLPGGATVVHVGLSFTPDLQTLDAAGVAKDLKKVVSAIAFEVNDSRGLSVGQTFDKLTEWPQRQVSDGYGVPGYATELVRVAVRSSWSNSVSACLRQTYPLPAMVTGLTLEVEGGGQ